QGRPAYATSLLSLHGALPILRQLAKAGALDDVCAANRAMVYDVIECWAKQSKTKSQSRTDRAVAALQADPQEWLTTPEVSDARLDRKSTRLNSSHVKISYAVF